jgi:hypothetical protein
MYKSIDLSVFKCLVLIKLGIQAGDGGYLNGAGARRIGPNEP